MTRKKPTIKASERFPEKTPIQAQPMSAGDGVIIGFVLCMVIGLGLLKMFPLPEDTDDKPPVITEAQISPEQFDAMSDALNAKIDAANAERDKYKQDYYGVIVDAKRNVEIFEAQRTADIKEIATLKNRIILNKSALDVCLGKVDEARGCPRKERAMREKAGRVR